MTKGIVVRSVTYAKKTIIQNQLFQHHTELEPLFTLASKFQYGTFREWLDTV